MNFVNLVGLALVHLLGSSRLVVGQQSACTDALDAYTCYKWRVDNICSDMSYRSLAIDNCRRSCNLCYRPPIVRVIPDPIIGVDNSRCEDKKDYCMKWRKHCEEGERYYDVMKKNCQRTCLFCTDQACQDNKPKCEAYRNLGYCKRTHRYHKFMKSHCEQSCKFCLPPDNDEIINSKPMHARVYSKEFLCEFESDECDWSNQIFEDTANWVVGLDKHGPTTGFNNSGKYLYLDGAYEDYYGYLLLPWELILPDNSSARVAKMCLHFRYQMSDGEITVSQRAIPSLTNKTPSRVVKYKSGTKVRNWKHVKVNNIRASDRYHLMIKGTKGHQESFIAIDHVFFTRGECY